jgi:hypothetical protein
MRDRYSERGGQRWEDNDRRYRDRDRESSYDRGFLERFADEMRSWFGNEEAQRRRMRDEQEDWRDEHPGSDWGWRDRGRDWGRSDWPRGESIRSSSDFTRGPDERRWSRDWGWIEGRERDWGRPGREFREYASRDWMPSGPHRGRGPRNYQRSDERIREDLCERFTHHSYLDPSDIDIRVQNGQVTLDGSVSDRWAKRTAEDLAENVSGVTEVLNRLRIVQVEVAPEQRADTGPQRGTWAA